MLNYIRTSNLVFTVNSYSLTVHAGRYPSFLSGKFTKCGNVILNSNLSQASKLKYIMHKCNIPDSDSIICNVPKNLWKPRSDFIITYSFVVHKETAKEVADTVMDSVFKKSKEPIVIELNPGFGLITNQLFERGLKNLVVYDPFSLNPFKEILKKYSGKIQLHEMNAFDTKTDFSRNMYLKFFHYMSDMKDNEIVITGVSPNRLFFRRLIYFISNFSFSCCNNVEFYLTIPNKIYNCLTSLEDKNARVSDYGCFSVLFNAEILKKYPRDYFLPLSTVVNSDVYFVRISKKIQILSKEDFLLYMNFLKIIGSRKSNYVIGELEKWFPGSGPHFIAEGVSPTNQTFEFAPQDLLRLFNILRHLEGYHDSLFLMKTYDSNFSSELKLGD